MSKDKKKYSGFPGDCSQEQLKALDQFRNIVATHNKGVLDPRWDQIYLLRFLRARKFNLKETEKMWVNFIAWRAKNNVDSAKFYYFPELLQLRKVYPHGYHKYDKNYSPVYIERIGLTNIQEIWKFVTPDRMLLYYITLYETLLDTIFDACTEQRKRQTGNPNKVTQTCTIIDLKDVKLSNTNAAYKFVKPASEMAQNNYPQILGNMYILNAPFLFTGIWAVVRMWIDDKTKEKIHILGSGYKKDILKQIDPENLPDIFDGGKCSCKGGCLGNNVGPWNPKGQQFYPNCLTETKPQTVKIESSVQKQEQLVKEQKKQVQSQQKKEEKEEEKEKKEEVKEEKKEEEKEVKQQKQTEVEIKKQEG